MTAVVVDTDVVSLTFKRHSLAEIDLLLEATAAQISKTDICGKAKGVCEISVISYLTSRPSRDIVVAGHQRITQDWTGDATRALSSCCVTARFAGSKRRGFRSGRRKTEGA